MVTLMSITEAKSRSLKENDMKDNALISGRVKVEIIRANGAVEIIPEHDNDITTALKVAITDSLQAGVTFGISQTALFDGDKFVAPTTNQSGIIVKTSGSNYESITTEGSGTSKQYQYIGIVRAENEKILVGAELGYKWTGSIWTTQHAEDTFNQTLQDGDQLTITWTITYS